MIKIKLGDIFRKDYVDFNRHFIALADSVGMYCDCLDLLTGDHELVKLPIDGYSVTKIEILS